MDMHIVVPKGTIYLNGAVVQSLKRNPYTVVDGEKVYLTEDEKRLAREMTKAFKPLIEEGV